MHQQYMTPLRRHLISVRDKLGLLMQRLSGFAVAIINADRQTFLGPLLQGLGYYMRESLGTARINNASIEHTIGLLADELVAPGFDYTSHPRTLPSVPEAGKRMAMSASLKKAALRPLSYLAASDRNSASDTARRWMAIIERVRNSQGDVAMEGA